MFLFRQMPGLTTAVFFLFAFMPVSGLIGPTTELHAAVVLDDDEAEEKNRQMIQRLKETFPGDENKSLVSDLGKVVKQKNSTALITNDAVILGILCLMLGFVFWTSSIKTGICGMFYKVIPMLLVCYFLPSLLTFFEIVDHHNSKLYFVATRYLLPATLVLLTLSICLLYTSPSPRDATLSRMPSSA